MDKTPIQEAIEIIKARIPKKPNCYFDDGLERAYEEAVEELKALLPKEKEFVEKVFDSSGNTAFSADSRLDWKIKKQNFINQLYPKQ